MVTVCVELEKWSRKYINDLPDNAFAYIEPGGEKDESGKTTPRSLRHLPYKDKNGNLDAPHTRNALARLKQTKISRAGKEEALRKLKRAAKRLGIDSETILSLSRTEDLGITYFDVLNKQQTEESNKRIDDLADLLHYETNKVLEKEYDGIHAVLHKKGDKVVIHCFNSLESRKVEYMRIKESALEHSEDFILSGVISDNGNSFDKFNANDILLLNDVPVYWFPLLKRIQTLKKLKLSGGIMPVKAYKVKDREDLISGAMVLSKLEGTSGVRIREPSPEYYSPIPDLIYRPLGNFRAVVLSKPKGDTYDIGLSYKSKKIVRFSDCIETKVDLSVGDIIEISLDNVVLDDSVNKLKLVRPIFRRKIESGSQELSQGISSTSELLHYIPNIEVQ